MAKVSLKQASKGLNTFDLSGHHITTTDFGQTQVSNIIPVVPGDKIHINMASEARFAPMVVPTYMSVKLYNRAFFVPMSSIWKSFEYYYTDKQDSSALKILPTHTNKFFSGYFANSPKNLAIDITSTYEVGQKFDFFYDNKYYLFTEQGRLFYKLLLSLGYSVNFTTADETLFSWLPLIAFLRICYDYLYPSQYVDSLSLTRFFNITSQADFDAIFNNDTASASLLDSVVDCLALPFNQDYFTAAWKNLNAPGTSVQTLNITSPRTDFNGSELLKSNSSMVFTEGNLTGQSKSVVTQFGLNILSRLYDFVTRNNLVGTRFADQIFARFGIGSKQSDPDMSREIGRYVQPVQVQDVTQMAQTSEGALGEQGGKSIIFGNKGNLCDFDSSEFGYIIVVSTLIPDIGYYQGRKRWTLAQSSRLDNFYYPEFDMQMRAIRNDELFADYKSPSDYSDGQSYGGNPVGVFGFAPNYSEYKIGYDYLTGDFRLDSLRSNLDAYHLFRDIPKPSASDPLALNSSFLFCKQHQFDKIFQQPYTVRLPITYQSARIFVHGQPVILQGSGNLYFLFAPAETESLQIFTAAGVSGDDLSDFHVVHYTLTDGGNTLEFSLFGRSFFCNPNSGGYVFYMDSPSIYEVSSVNMFLSLFSDYIDHVYLHHYFDIKASRPMATISEEFMIDDGGQLLNVDMLGNH